MTDPAKFCKDPEKYEKALSEGVDELHRLMAEGYIAWKPAEKLWYGLLKGLYDNGTGNVRSRRRDN